MPSSPRSRPMGERCRRASAGVRFVCKIHGRDAIILHCEHVKNLAIPEDVPLQAANDLVHPDADLSFVSLGHGQRFDMGIELRPIPAREPNVEDRLSRIPLPSGLMFAVFGANGFLHFIPQPPPANPIAAQFFTSITASHFAVFIFAVQLVAGLLLLSGYFVPLALTLLAAVLYNVLAFHLTMAPGIAPGLVACVLWILVFLQYLDSFKGILAPKP